MRTLIAAAFLAVCLGTAAADGPKAAKTDDKEPTKKEKTLAVGDPAPAIQATKWLQGSEVKSFEAGKVYVVEFWATWCGPCIVMMPHMSEMQAEYKDKGVTFIGFSAKDSNNTQEKVATFVEKLGPKLGYTFAYADNRDTYNDWMAAAKQNGIPCSFVVDQKGKIAYIGHPMYLDEVLPKVVAGKWTPADVKGMAKVEEDVNNAFKSFGNPNPEEGLKTLAEFEKNHPKLAFIPYFVSPKIGLLLKAKKMDEARSFAQKAIAHALKQDNASALMDISTALRAPAANKDKELLSLSLGAATAAVKVAGDKDALALLTLAQTYHALGEKDKAKEVGEKAVAATAGESQGLKKYVQDQVKKLED